MLLGLLLEAWNKISTNGNACSALEHIEEGMERLGRGHAAVAVTCSARQFVPGEDPEDTPFTKATRECW